jgi:hypothetical protein
LRTFMIDENCEVKKESEDEIETLENEWRKSWSFKFPPSEKSWNNQKWRWSGLFIAWVNNTSHTEFSFRLFRFKFFRLSFKFLSFGVWNDWCLFVYRVKFSSHRYTSTSNKCS